MSNGNDVIDKSFVSPSKLGYIFDKFSFLRDDQRSLLLKILSKIEYVFENEKFGYVICVSAPTGFGKTIIALAISHLLNKFFDYSCAIFVRTRNQLSSYVRDSVKFLNELPSVNINKTESCMLVEEAESWEFLPCSNCEYLSNLKMFALYHDKIESRYVNEVVKYIQENKIYDPYLIGEQFIHKVWSFCPYYFFKHINPGIVVCTYPYLVHPVISKKLIYRPNVVIVDEAHNLEDAFIDRGGGISIETIKRAIDELEELSARGGLGKLKPSVKEDVENLKNFSAKVLPTVSEIEKMFLEYVSNFPDGTLVKNYHLNKLEELLMNTDVLEYLERIVSILRVVISEKVEKGRKVKIRVASITNFLKNVKILFENNLLGLDYVLVKEGKRICIKCVKPWLMYEKLFSNFEITILMSGTLPDKEYIVKVWGIPENEIEYIDFSNIQFGKVSKYVVTGLTTKYEFRKEEMWKTYAKVLMKIYEKAKKHVLIVFPSYEVLNIFTKIIPPNVNTVVETDETKFGEVDYTLKKAFEKGEKYMIFAVAGGKLVEGIEFTINGKSILSDVVIVGIPYPKPTQLQQLIEKNVCKVCKVDEKFLRKVKAWIRVRQALGRGVRHVEDKCNWWFLDNRYLDKYWLNKLKDIKKIWKDKLLQ